jgi:hypothetical protein
LKRLDGHRIMRINFEGEFIPTSQASWPWDISVKPTPLFESSYRRPIRNHLFHQIIACARSLFAKFRLKPTKKYGRIRTKEMDIVHSGNPNALTPSRPCLRPAKNSMRRIATTPGPVGVTVSQIRARRKQGRGNKQPSGRKPRTKRQVLAPAQ